MPVREASRSPKIGLVLPPPPAVVLSLVVGRPAVLYQRNANLLIELRHCTAALSKYDSNFGALERRVSCKS